VSLADLKAAFRLSGPRVHTKKVRTFRRGYHDNRNIRYTGEGPTRRRWKLHADGKWRSSGQVL